jgi:hypothetical protein
MLRHSKSPATKMRVHHFGDTREKHSPWTARTTREYTMYKVPVNKQGGRRRKITCRRKGTREPV